MLQDPNLDTTYILVDALDECTTDLPKMLHFLAQQSSAPSRVKWIVSSRNWPEIEAQLGRAEQKIRLSLELNAESVSAAVSVFIRHKVSQLAQEKKYNKKTQNAVFEHLTSNANDTFLWVALVCQDLEKTAKRNVQKKLKYFPPGLDALYERMMQQIGASDDAELCKQVLATIALVYRPVTLAELVSLTELLEDFAEAEVREIVGLCGSFLTLRGETVYFVHQSAQDFLLEKATNDVFPDVKRDSSQKANLGSTGSCCGAMAAVVGGGKRTAGRGQWVGRSERGNGGDGGERVVEGAPLYWASSLLDGSARDPPRQRSRCGKSRSRRRRRAAGRSRRISWIRSAWARRCS